MNKAGSTFKFFGLIDLYGYQKGDDDTSGQKNKNIGI
jgi:hypothetical protein